MLYRCIIVLLLFQNTAVFAAESIFLSDHRIKQDRLIEDFVNVNLETVDKRFTFYDIRAKALNGYVLLYGNAPDDNLKRKAGNFTQRIAGVRKLFNQITIGNRRFPDSPLDDFITAGQIEKRLLFSKIATTNVRYVVYDDSIYLLGLVRRSNAISLLQKLQELKQIRYIYTMFEYIIETEEQ